MIWDRPWPRASMRDRVLMICGEWENGIDRKRLTRETKLPSVVLQRTLDRLVGEDWLHAEHPDEQPSRDSYYMVNEDRPGLDQLREFWFVEYGYMPDGQEELLANIEQPPSAEMADAARHASASLSEASARTVRQLQVQASREVRRAGEVWNLMQTIHWDGWEARERARDVIHLPPHHGIALPPRTVPERDRPTVALALALACRRMAREDAWKFVDLRDSSSAGYARAVAMSQVVHGGSKALDPFRPAHGARRGEALRAGVRMAKAAAALDNPRWRVDPATVGFAGEVALAYSYRDMSKRLEEIVTEVLALPELATATASPSFQEALGEPPSYNVGAHSWKGGTYALERRVVPSVQENEEGPVVQLEAPTELRAGDVIVAAGSRDLTAPVVVVSVDTEEETVDLAVPDAHSASVVPLSLLEYHGGLSVRRGAEEAAPLAD